MLLISINIADASIELDVRVLGGKNGKKVFMFSAPAARISLQKEIKLTNLICQPDIKTIINSVINDSILSLAYFQPYLIWSSFFAKEVYNFIGTTSM